MNRDELLAALEAATGPDRELDRAIVQFLNWMPSSAIPGNWFSSTAISAPSYKLPEFTASIDAALTLVPEGHDWVAGNPNGHVGGTPFCDVGEMRGHGETVALSICIAALKARTQ